MIRKFWKWSVLLLVLFTGWLYRELYLPVCCKSEPIVFEIASGESFQSVLPRLKEQRFIRHELPFRWFARFTNRDRNIKAGRFRLDPDLSAVQVLSFLVKPENGEISITIPEGFTISDIDKRLVSIGLIQKGEFIAWAATASSANVSRSAGPDSLRSSVEGYLFPDTYFVFSKNFDPKDLGQKMLQNFEAKTKNDRPSKDIIIMASILEKEVRTKADYPIVAGILWKRIKNGWPLQVDATLLYNKEDRTLSVDELRKDSPYNTYTRTGLPPTPIGNPGLTTIRAAQSPVDSPYWFYLTTPEGQVIYAKTNDEHNKNKREYLNP